MKPPVKIASEPLDSLRARYAKALEFVYDVQAIVDGGIHPGECAANVFDFEDGLRFIISRERTEDGEVMIHVSASFPPECRIADEFRLLGDYLSPAELTKRWMASLPGRFAELSGDTRDLCFAGVSDGLIPHFAIRG